ncbi:hypothetical protein INS49_014516 [Diaporthe citri]|uniref:uncharacterized protein n=1 Tax=Diaporthe citri TaxID=83186 RepID=UPI001C81F85C|nr:uncharacterized protein INS49_014516 [Diaporthe citri]KAG6356642.1 hypothetical protein INS49_014516 [Diaporthe citri]
MVECRQSSPYILDTASSRPNILHASTVETADIPRDAVQFGVKVSSRVKAGKVKVEFEKSKPPRPQETEAGVISAAMAGMAKAAAKLWSASPSPVPEDFANIGYRFIQDWAATQHHCPRPGLPIKRRRSVPRASPREPNPARASVDMARR